jgi:hypothetical protein
MRLAAMLAALACTNNTKISPAGDTGGGPPTGPQGSGDTGGSTGRLPDADFGFNVPDASAGGAPGRPARTCAPGG